MNDMNFRDVNDVKIRQLAQTLKANGLAFSESEAVRMATSMTSTEKKVSQYFEEHKYTAPMIRNYKPDPIIRAPGPMQQAFTAEEQRKMTAQAATHHSWENEVKVQDHPAGPAATPRQGPALHTNPAIAELIGNVQNHYAAPPQVDLGIVHAPAEEAPLAEVITQAQAVPSEQTEERRVVEEPLPDIAQAAPQQEAKAEEEHLEEHSREVFERAPQRPVTSFAEANVDLSNVFNFGKR